MPWIEVQEVDRIFREIRFFTINGLAEDDPDVKQFYFERILMSMGMSIKDVRDRLGVTHGTAPSDFQDILKILEDVEREIKDSE